MRVTTAICLVGVAACASQGAITRAETSPTVNAVESQVAFEGIVFDKPTGWSVAPKQCGLADKTIALGTWGFSCPSNVGAPPSVSAVWLTQVYGRQFALGWDGTRVDWQGQPGWLTEDDGQGVTTYVLTLPWLNVRVAAQSADKTEARALLDRVHPKPSSGLEVPDAAASVFLQSIAGTDGDGVQRNTTITAPADVRQLLDDLRSLTPIPAGQQPCEGQWWPNTALLTVEVDGHDAHTYAARFDNCAQVVAGTGTAAVVDNQLITDVTRLLPNSGLPA